MSENIYSEEKKEENDSVNSEDYDSFYFKVDEMNEFEKKKRVEELTDLILQNPSDLDLRIRRSIILRKTQSRRLELAGQDMEFVLSKLPDCQVALYNSGICKLDMKQLDRIPAVIERMFLLNKNDEWAYFLKALTNLEEYKTQIDKNDILVSEGVELLGKSAKRSKKGSICKIYAMQALARCYSKYECVMNLEASVKVYNDVLELRKESFLHYDLGKLYYHQLGEKKKAHDEFMKVLQLNPKYPKVNFFIGNYHRYHSKDYEKAVYYYQKEIDANPKYAIKAFYNKGYVLQLKLKRHDEALDNLSKSIELVESSERKYHFPYAQRANLYKRFYLEYELAEKDYVKSVEICESLPDSTRYIYNRYNVVLGFYRDLCFEFKYEKDIVKSYFYQKKFLKMFERAENFFEDKLNDPNEETISNSNKQKWDEDEIWRMLKGRFVCEMNDILLTRQDMYKEFFFTEEEREIVMKENRERNDYLESCCSQVVYCRFGNGKELVVHNFLMKFKILF